MAAHSKEAILARDKQIAANRGQTEPASQPTGKRGPDWHDRSVPAGDSPALPRWPLVLAATAWAAWLVFLVAMMALRIGSSGG